MTAMVLKADSICHRFGGRAVLTAATLTAVAGQINVVFGRNGSGKTTLLRIAAGLLRPDNGVLTYRGHIVQNAKLHRLAANGMFFLPDGGLLVRNLTVRMHFEALRSRFGVTDSGVISLLRLAELMDRVPDTLSGGERRRVEVGLAMTRAPACLLADEPMMGIAPLDAELVSASLRMLADRDCAVVITGHETATLLELGDTVSWVTSGTTHVLGSATDARAHWQFQREYLAR